MRCPVCNYDFYTLRNHVVTDLHHERKEIFDPGRLARKLWLNCPDCQTDFVAWIHFDYNPETSEAFHPAKPAPDHPTFN